MRGEFAIATRSDPQQPNEGSPHDVHVAESMGHGLSCGNVRMRILRFERVLRTPHAPFSSATEHMPGRFGGSAMDPRKNSVALADTTTMLPFLPRLEKSGLRRLISAELRT